MKLSPFETGDALKINEARGGFLKSFLPEMIREGQLVTALDAGCGGLGYFSNLLKGCGLKVTAFDVRPENIIQARKKNPSIDFIVHNIEDPSVANIGTFDLVLCTGLLYHLENPFLAIRNLYALTKKYLIIESQIAPYKSAFLVLYEEPHAINQSVNYVVSMPTESSLVKMLYKAGFCSVFSTYPLPDYPDFHSSPVRRRVRTVLIACKQQEGFLRKLGAVKFSLMREPRIPSVSLFTWYWFGKLFLIKQPQVFLLNLIDLTGKLIPRVLIRSLCKYIAVRPKPLRQRAGGVLGSVGGIPGILRFLVWRWFSSKCSNDTIVFEWHKKIRVYARPIDETSQMLFVGGNYDPNEMCFLEDILKPGMVFIDIGSNIGLYTLFASRLIGEEGTVIAVEPSKRELLRLKANLKLNRCKNVKVISTAISDCSSTGELLIADEEHSGHNTFGNFSYPSVFIQGKQMIKKKKLDDLIDELSLNRVNVIKIDVEGHELFVLKGALKTVKRFKPILLIELFDRALELQGCNSNQVLELLRQLGYYIYVYDKKTGLPVPQGDRTLGESENIIAVHETSKILR